MYLVIYDNGNGYFAISVASSKKQAYKLFLEKANILIKSYNLRELDNEKVEECIDIKNMFLLVSEHFKLPYNASVDVKKLDKKEWYVID